MQGCLSAEQGAYPRKKMKAGCTVYKNFQLHNLTLFPIQALFQNDVMTSLLKVTWPSALYRKLAVGFFACSCGAGTLLESSKTI